MSKTAGKKRASPGADDPKGNPLEDVVLTAEQEDKLDKAQKEIERADLILERRTNVYLKPIWVKRRDVVKQIDNFWPIALKNHGALNLHIQHKEDILALMSLQEVWIEHDPVEFRAFTIEFHFKENPFFSDTMLKKVYQYKPSEAAGSVTADDDGISEAALHFEWDRDIEVQPISISWKSDSKALTKLHPRVSGEDDDDDIIPEVGSFFHFFEQKDDPFDIGNTIAHEIFPDAINYFLGKVEGAGDVDDDDSEEDEEDDEDEDEIDLEKPRKKVKKA